MLIKRYFKTKKRHKRILFVIIFYFILSIIMDIFIIKYIPIYKVINNNYSVNIKKKDFLVKIGINSYIPKEVKSKTVFKENSYKVYIYNTHQEEEYVDYDVYNASIDLCKLLRKRNIICDNESANISEELAKNNYSYNYSYRITREFLEKKINKYDLYIDFHRDSSSRDATLININNKNYARVMFVMGKKHDSWNSNYLVFKSFDDLVKGFDVKLSRGIFTRDNSSFNQDLSSNVILIEVGGNKNNKEEVSNTLEVLSDTIYKYLYN